MSSRLNILPWNLYLDIRPIHRGYLLLKGLLLGLTLRTVEVLSSLVRDLSGRAPDGQIDLLSRASSSRSSSSFRSVVPVSFNTFYEAACFWIDFGKWINCVVLSAISVAISSNITLNEGSIAGAPFGSSVRNAVDVAVTSS